MALLDRLRTNTPTQSRRNEAMSDSGGKTAEKDGDAKKTRE